MHDFWVSVRMLVPLYIQGLSQSGHPTMPHYLTAALTEEGLSWHHLGPSNMQAAMICTTIGMCHKYAQMPVPYCLVPTLGESC